MGIAFVFIFGRTMLDQHKPFMDYPLPAFFSDGYGVVQQLLQPDFYVRIPFVPLLVLLVALCGMKIAATCVTLGSGGSGGIIAPSLFLGATAGAALGLVLQATGLFALIRPEVYALVGMGAVLAAVVHAPLAAILILLELTRDDRIILPAMLSTITSVGMARFIFRDSIYTLSLRLRGVRVGTSGDMVLLRRLSVDQVDLEPAATVRIKEPLQRIVELMTGTGTTDFIVLDERGGYAGMVVAEDIKVALLEREAVPLLVVGEIMRNDVAPVAYNEDLASVLDSFSLQDVSRLPVCISRDSGRVVGLISRAALMKRYQQALSES